MSAYLDTSALAKWYFPEEGSEAFEGWFRSAENVWTSSLTMLEFRSIAARRVRMEELTEELGAKLLAAVAADQRAGFIVVRPLESDAVVTAERVFDECADVPLRTLDALHLEIARRGDASEVVTGDEVMALAAEVLGLAVRFFG